VVHRAGSTHHGGARSCSRRVSGRACARLHESYTEGRQVLMSSSLTLRAHTNLRWLWLLVPGLAVFVSLRSFLVLQLLSAILLFAVLFVMLAALVAVFVALVVGFDRIIQWTLVALISLTRSFASWSCDVWMLPHHASCRPARQGTAESWPLSRSRQSGRLRQRPCQSRQHNNQN